MIVGFNFLGESVDNTVFKATNVINNVYRAEMKQGIFDEIYITEDINSLYNNLKEEWTYKTVLDGRFQDNIEGGSVDLGGIPILQIKFQKRKKEDLYWEDIATVNYDSLVKVYSVIDKYIQNGCEYEYCVFPLTESVGGTRILKDITADFEGVWLTDKNNNYKLIYNLQMDSIEHINPSAVFEPLDGKYPIVSYNSLDYRKNSITALVLSDSTINSSDIDVRQEKLNRTNLMGFLKNHKPKIFRNSGGEYMMVSIIGNPREIPNNNLGQAIADVSFEFVEINEINNDTLYANGLR